MTYSSFRLSLLATAFGATLVVLPASAQDYGRYDNDTMAPNESVTVTAPQFRFERNTMGLPGKLTLRREVSYRDLDLRSHDGARALKTRVSDTVREICDQLRDAYPLKQQPMEHCFTNAYRDAMLKADAAIRDARSSAYYQARYAHD
jgi:UrcA family protein